LCHSELQNFLIVPRTFYSVTGGYLHECRMQMHGIDSSVVFDNREWPCVIVVDLPLMKSGYR